MCAGYIHRMNHDRYNQHCVVVVIWFSIRWDVDCLFRFVTIKKEFVFGFLCVEKALDFLKKVISQSFPSSLKYLKIVCTQPRRWSCLKFIFSNLGTIHTFMILIYLSNSIVCSCGNHLIDFNVHFTLASSK